MLLKQLNRVNSGLYFIHWASGGGSIAAIGMLPDGGRWIAPTNWIMPTWEGQKGFLEAVRNIERLELITTQQEACNKRRVDYLDRQVPVSEQHRR